MSNPGRDVNQPRRRGNIKESILKHSVSIEILLGCGVGLYVFYLLRRNNTLLANILSEVHKMRLEAVTASGQEGSDFSEVLGDLVEQGARTAIPHVIQVIGGLLLGS